MKFLMPTPHTIEVRDRTDGPVDVFGDAEVTWGPWRDLRVYYIAPVSSTEPKVVGTDRIVVDVEVGVPELPPTGLGQFRLADGRVFEVVGTPEDWNQGPFDFHPGFVINGRCVSG